MHPSIKMIFMTNTSNPKNSTKIILIVVFILIIVVAVLVAVFYCGSLNPAHEQSVVVTNFSDGAWANYSLTIYSANGTIASTGKMIVCAFSGTYNGVDCWVYVENTTYTNSYSSTVSDGVTDYLDKSTYSTLYKTEQITSDGALIYNETFSPGDADFMDTISTVRNFAITATDKSVTVPAGTFSTTERHGPITYASDPTVYQITSWTSKDVSTWGVVKYQFHLNGVLFSEYLLEYFGS